MRLKIVKYTIAILLILASFIARSQEWETADVQQFKTFDDFEHLLNIDSDSTYLINFWATWCGPCVKELPYIEGLVDVYKNEKFKNILVSLDFENKIESKLIPFLNKHQIQSDVVVLLDGKASKWIDRVDPRWSGAIPITIVYNKEKRLFFEQQFHSVEELTDIIDTFIDNTK